MPKLVLTELSALTRMTWVGRVLVDDGVKLNRAVLEDLTKAVYDEVDGGDYDQDPYFWERGEACESRKLADPYSPTDVIPPSLVATRDPTGLVRVATVEDGEDPLTVLAELKAEIAAEEGTNE